MSSSRLRAQLSISPIGDYVQRLRTGTVSRIGSPKGVLTGVLVCGVGGQGVLLASEIVAEAAFRSGHDVKKSDVHGMAQRGGRVVSHVRFGSHVYSPLIPEGEADILLALEKMEALASANYLRPGGIAIVNDLELPPLGVLAGRERYPGGVVGFLEAVASEVVICDAQGMAAEIGNPRTSSVLLVGVLAAKLSLPREKWLEAVAETVPTGTLEVNREAFQRGYQKICTADDLKVR